MVRKKEKANRISANKIAIETKMIDYERRLTYKRRVHHLHLAQELQGLQYKFHLSILPKTGPLLQFVLPILKTLFLCPRELGLTRLLLLSDSRKPAKAVLVSTLNLLLDSGNFWATNPKGIAEVNSQGWGN